MTVGADSTLNNFRAPKAKIDRQEKRQKTNQTENGLPNRVMLSLNEEKPNQITSPIVQIVYSDSPMHVREKRVIKMDKNLDSLSKAPNSSHLLSGNELVESYEW